MSAPVLDIRGLRVQAMGRALLDDASIQVQRGQLAGVIGESGAGKSTLGLAALGYYRAGCEAVAGQVLLCGTDLRALAVDDVRAVRRRHGAYVAQSAANAFNPAWRIGDQVLEVRRLAGRDGDEASFLRALFESLELPDPAVFGRRFPHQVSGGQLQRAMLAMALASEPDLIVFDEPTTALDVTTQLEVLRTVRSVLRGRGLAGLYISHDIALVAQMTDHMLVLRDGRSCESGPTRRLVDAPSQAYTRALVAARTANRAQPLAAPARSPRVALQQVGAGYGRGPLVVRDVSVDLHPGEVLAVVGQSGSGKSTLARVATGLLAPRSGRALLEGELLAPVVEGRTLEQRRRIQLVHQSPDASVNPRQRVREIVGRPIEFFFGAAPAAVEERTRVLLKDTGLDAAFMDRLPQTLSGGQKQRMCIARALAADPDVLVCDEVTSALDPLIEDSVVEMLGRVQRQRGLAILFITHNLVLAQRIAHRVLVMRSGEVVEQGTSAAVFEHPAHPYTRSLLSAVPTLEPGWLERQLV